MKDVVTFDKLKRRMVYELTNWSNSATAADVSSGIFTRFSRTDWSRPFTGAAAHQHVFRAQENV
jgi:hypothetical protein